MTPSYRIVFYISGHGFGHASRSRRGHSRAPRARPEAGDRRQDLGAAADSFDAYAARPMRARRVAVPTRAWCRSTACNLDAAESIRRAVAFQRRMPHSRPSRRRAYCGERGADRRRRRHSRRWRSPRPPRPGFRRSRSAISRGTGSTRAIRDHATRLLADAIRAALPDRDAGAAPADVWRIRRAGTRDAGYPVHRAARRSATPDDVRQALGLPPRATASRWC